MVLRLFDEMRMENIWIKRLIRESMPLFPPVAWHPNEFCTPGLFPFVSEASVWTILAVDFLKIWAICPNLSNCTLIVVALAVPSLQRSQSLKSWRFCTVNNGATIYCSLCFCIFNVKYFVVLAGEHRIMISQGKYLIILGVWQIWKICKNSY